MGGNTLAAVLVAVFLVGFFVLLFFGIGWFVRRVYAATEKQFRLLAAQFELEYIDEPSSWRHWLNKYPRLEGNYAGYFINIFVEVRGGGKNRQTYTVFEINCPRLRENGLSFEVYREGFFSKIGKALGAQDIELGNENFDGTFMVKGNSEAVVKRLLNRTAQQILLDNKDLFNNEISLNSGIIRYGERLQIIRDDQRKHFEKTIKIAMELVKALHDNERF